MSFMIVFLVEIDGSLIIVSFRELLILGYDIIKDLQGLLLPLTINQSYSLVVDYPNIGWINIEGFL